MYCWLDFVCMVKLIINFFFIIKSYKIFRKGEILVIWIFLFNLYKILKEGKICKYNSDFLIV